MNDYKRHKIFEILSQTRPKPNTELKYHNHFELLIAVILSAQATDKQVNKVTPQLFKVASDPYAMVQLGETSLQYYIRSIGLYQNKAKNIIKASQQLIDEYDGKIPQTRKELEKLAGVGRKTANVILNTAFNESTIAVDTHIFRLANRTKLAPGKNVGEVEQQLLQNIPYRYIKNAHHWLILHGRYICTAQKPKCFKCPIYNYCEYEHKLMFKTQNEGSNNALWK
jgi:endonuclease-3